MSKQNILKVSAILAGIFCASGAHAVCPPIGVGVIWQPPAIATLKTIDAAFSGYETVTTQAIRIGFSNVQNAAVDANMSIVKAMMKAAQDKAADKYKIAATSQNIMMDFERKVAIEKNKAENEIIHLSSNGVPSESTYNYFKGICRASKINSAVVDPTASFNHIKQTRMDDSLLERESAANGASSNMKLAGVKDHYVRYCDESGRAAGYCSALAKIPNADILSFVFLHPMNSDDKRVVASEGYVTGYTYSAYEKEAAEKYMENLVPSLALPKLSNSMFSDKDNSVAASRVRQLTAAMNLARFNVREAYKNRLPINGGVSRLDSLHMMVASAEDRGLSSVKAASAKGKKLMILNQMNMRTYLENELSRYDSQRNDLMASYLSIRASTPSVLKTMKSG